MLHPTNGLRIEPPSANASLRSWRSVSRPSAATAPDDHARPAPAAAGWSCSGSPLSSRSRQRFDRVAIAHGRARRRRSSSRAASRHRRARRPTASSRTLIGGVNVESDFDLGALYDTDEGLRFTGSATIEIAIPTHLTLGPIEIPHDLPRSADFKDGAIPIEFSADLSAAARAAARQPSAGWAPRPTSPSRQGRRQRRRRPDRRSASSRRTASAWRSTPASSRAAATSTSTRTGASTPARSS